MAIELRCGNGILFGILDDCVLKVKCRSSRCGAGAGVVVLHYFDLGKGGLPATRKFKDPATRKDGDASI